MHMIEAYTRATANFGGLRPPHLPSPIRLQRSAGRSGIAPPALAFGVRLPHSCRRSVCPVAGASVLGDCGAAGCVVIGTCWVMIVRGAARRLRA